MCIGKNVHCCLLFLPFLVIFSDMKTTQAHTSPQTAFVYCIMTIKRDYIQCSLSFLAQWDICVPHLSEIKISSFVIIISSKD